MRALPTVLRLMVRAAEADELSRTYQEAIYLCPLCINEQTDLATSCRLVGGYRPVVRFAVARRRLVLLSTLGLLVLTERIELWMVYALAAGLGFVATLNAYEIPERRLAQMFEARGEVMPEGLTVGYGVPFSVLLLIAIATAMTIVAQKTRLGRYIFAIGSNEDATRLSGVRTMRYKASAYVISGTMAGLAGVEDHRPDVALIAAPMLTMDWYRQWVRDRYPDLIVPRYAQPAAELSGAPASAAAIWRAFA